MHFGGMLCAYTLLPPPFGKSSYAPVALFNGIIMIAKLF